MLPLFFTSQAEKLFPKRWWFFGVSIVGMAGIFLLLNSGITKSMLPVALLMPFILVPWALLCMCVWFHPTQGKLYVGPITAKSPTALQTFIRWYSALFLMIFFVVGLVGFPIFALIANG